MTTTVQGYTRAEAKARPSLSPGTVRWIAVAVIAIVGLVAVLALARNDEDYTPLSINNYDPEGARALAEIARDRGLDIRQVDALGDAAIRDPANTTVVVAGGQYLQAFQVRSLLDYPGDVVILEPGIVALETLDLPLSTTSTDVSVRTAQCSNADALAAGTLETAGLAFEGDLPAGAEGCFPRAFADATSIHLARDGDSLTLVADSEIVLNRSLASEGNAAYALRLIGAQTHAVWYVGSLFDDSRLTWVEPGSGGGGNPLQDLEASPDFLPTGWFPVVYMLALAVIPLVWWRARRFGPLVTEPLPVVIRASEATRGRARLYRSARATGRAAASLRAAAAVRMARTLGVARAAGSDALVAAIARAAGRHRDDVAHLLYGPPPQGESAMMDLIASLDALESEVHRT